MVHCSNGILGEVVTVQLRLRKHGNSLEAQLIKNLPAVQETWVQSLGQKDPHILGVARSRHNLATKSCYNGII